MKFLVLFFVLLWSSNAIAEQKADKLFSECAVEGSVTLYDTAQDRWIVSNEVDVHHATLPASTFKIIHSLIALDTGVTDMDEIFKWDGTDRAISVWNQNATLKSAFQLSMVWVYEVLAQRIEKGTYAHYLELLDYGNNNLENYNTLSRNFWVKGAFAVSPAEQIEMLRRLYNNTLPFSLKSQEAVKGWMRQDTAKEPLYGKTGWTQDNGHHIGWWIGYIEREAGPLYFATRLLKEEKEPLEDFSQCRKTITAAFINMVLQ